MQSVWSRIWTRVAVSISYDDNHDTTGSSYIMFDYVSTYICITAIQHFSGQLSETDCSLLPSFVNCLSLSSLGSSLPAPLPVSRSGPFCGFCAKTLRDLVCGTNINGNKCYPSCHRYIDRLRFSAKSASCKYWAPAFRTTDWGSDDSKLGSLALYNKRPRKWKTLDTKLVLVCKKSPCRILSVFRGWINTRYF